MRPSNPGVLTKGASHMVRSLVGRASDKPSNSNPNRNIKQTAGHLPAIRSAPARAGFVRVAGACGPKGADSTQTFPW
ncbi:unnamed protein product [Boreogadus saida]